ncbi:putative cytochrome c oxidase assembly protein (SCO2) [Candidatus Nasuia deltocephalinicola str. NAS-ALF]|uniref:Cytochrome c oxidase assembly protein (SCO2) n=1 Tax=Candidatus Nasuia deltocephalinicola str. NAS-ALF TaxID=1343077 RepID=S5TF06_9PROT|nr:putative cytochrome c oxidase assembly protein (SCO2) [Candidatus Nasuia deltocephalinicola str. NAS-ALF]
MFNIFKNIIIIYIVLKIIKKKNFKNIKDNINKYKNYIILKNKKLKNKNFLKINKNIYFGYILCSNKCPKIIKKIKNFKIKKIIFISINSKENNKLLDKNLNKIKINKLKCLHNNKKEIIKISKIFKIIYKYKNEKLNHSSLIYKIKKNFINIKI